MMRLDDSPEEEWIKALIYGHPGTGKTSFGVSAPDPLILLSERQGMRHIRDAARRQGKAVPPVAFMTSLDDYRAALRTLRAPKPEDGRFVIRAQDGAVLLELDHYPQTVVIDSLTDACELVRLDVYRDAPPQKASDGLDKVTERHWAALRDRCEKLIRSFRDVPAHVLFLCHLDERTIGEDEEKTKWMGPMLPMRALPNKVLGSVNVVGVTARRILAKENAEADRGLEHYIITIGPEWMMTKPHRPLRDREVPDFSDWIRRIRESELDDAEHTYDQPSDDEARDLEKAVRA